VEDKKKAAHNGRLSQEFLERRRTRAAKESGLHNDVVDRFGNINPEKWK
jgi:hypothetical protein